MAPFMKLICMLLIHKLVLLVSQVNLCNADWDANVSSTKDHGPALSAGVNALFYPSLGGTHARTLSRNATHTRESYPTPDSILYAFCHSKRTLSCPRCRYFFLRHDLPFVLNTLFRLLSTLLSEQRHRSPNFLTSPSQTIPCMVQGR